MSSVDSASINKVFDVLKFSNDSLISNKGLWTIMFEVLKYTRDVVKLNYWN